MKKTTVWFFFQHKLSVSRYSKRLGEKCFVSRICQIKLDIAAAVAAGVGAIANRILLARWHEVQSSIGNSRESFIHKSHTCLNTWRGTFFHGYWLLREKWIWERQAMTICIVYWRIPIGVCTWIWYWIHIFPIKVYKVGTVELWINHTM